MAPWSQLKHYVRAAIENLSKRIKRLRRSKNSRPTLIVGKVGRSIQVLWLSILGGSGEFGGDLSHALCDMACQLLAVLLVNQKAHGLVGNRLQRTSPRQRVCMRPESYDDNAHTVDTLCNDVH